MTDAFFDNQWLGGTTTNAQGQCGLFLTDAEAKAVPLKSRHVKATLLCDTELAETTEVLSYLAGDEDCNVKFKFPLPPRAAVYKFTAKFGEQLVTTKTKKRATARSEYQHAVSQGHSAALVRQEQDAGVFTVDLGNLKAGTPCEVQLSYLRKLDRIDNVLEYTHTATWVPPYIGSAGDQAAGVDKVVNATPKFASQVSYTLSYDIRVQSDARIQAVTSSSHKDAIVVADEASADEGDVKTVQLKEGVSDASRDFQLLVELDRRQLLGDRLHVQKCQRADGPKTVAQAIFVPKVDSSALPQAAKREVWLVVDCSGSMSGAPEQQARDAATLFIKDLPTDAGVKFNIVTFGSAYRLMTPQCQEYGSTSEAQAVSWVQANVNADQGGTEFLNVLRAVYSVPVSEGYMREILFLTDGGISDNEMQNVYALIQGKPVDSGDDLSASRYKPSGFGFGFGFGFGGGQQPEADGCKADVAKANAAATHVFPLGIGHGVHRSALDGMAARSCGAAQYVVDGKEIAPKCAYLARCALSPASLRRPRVVAKNCLVRLQPAILPPMLFPGEPLMVLAEVLHAEASASLALEAELAGQVAVRGELALTLDDDRTQAGEAFAVLHAMGYIQSLMTARSALHLLPDGSPVASPPKPDDVVEEIIRVACEENLVTPHTASVGVLLQKDPVDPSKTKNVEVPLQVPTGRSLWAGPDFGQGGGLYSMPTMAACGGAPSQGHVMRYAAAPRAMPFAAFGAACMAAAPSPAVPSAAPAFGAAFGAAAPCMAPPAPKSAPWSSFGKGSGRGGFARQNECSRASAPPSMGGVPLPPAPPGRSPPLRDMRDEDMVMEDICDVSDGAWADDCPELRDATLSGRSNYGLMVIDQAQPDASAPDQGATPDVDKDPRGVLRALNMLRTTDGFWSPEPALLVLLFSKDNTAPAQLPPMPAGISDDRTWATVLVLAFLHKRLKAERSTWESMGKKAAKWLEGQGVGGSTGQSLGSLIMAAQARV